MKSLAAILFHASAAHEKAEKAHAPKQGDSFAHVLQASLGDSRRDSRPGSSSAPSAEALPETAETRAPAAETVKHDQVEDELASRTVPVRRGQDKPGAHIGLNATRNESARQDHSVRAGTKPQLHQSHRSYSAKPSPQAIDAHRAEAPRAETGCAQPLPSEGRADMAPASQRSKAARSSHETAIAGLSPSLTKSPIADPTDSPSSTGRVVTELSGENNMSPHTNAAVSVHANPGVPSSRSGDHVRPHAWKIAGEELARTPVASQEVQAVPSEPAAPAEQEALPLSTLGDNLQTQPELPIQPAPGPRTRPETSTSDLVAPTKLETAPVRSEAQASRSQPALPDGKAPVIEHPTVARELRTHGEPVDGRPVSGFAKPAPASPDRPTPSSEPSHLDSHSATVPAAAEKVEAPSLAPNSGADVSSHNAAESTGETAVVPSPTRDPLALPRAREPGSLPRPHLQNPEGHARSSRQDTISPSTVAPKTDRTRPMPLPTAPSDRKTSEVSQNSSELRPAVLSRSTENHDRMAPPLEASPPADPAIPDGEPMLVVPSDSDPTLTPPPPLSRSFQDLATTVSEGTPQTTASSPVELPARPVAKPATSVAQAKTIPTHQTSDTPTARAGSQQVAFRPFAPRPENASRPAQPLESKLHHDTQAVPAANRRDGGPSHELPVPRSAGENRTHSNTQNTSKIPTGEEARSHGHTSPRSDALVQGFKQPASEPPQAASAEVGRDQTVRPVLQEAPSASLTEEPDLQPSTNEPTTSAPVLPAPVLPVRLASASSRDTVPSLPAASKDSLQAPSRPHNLRFAPAGSTGVQPSSSPPHTLRFAPAGITETQPPPSRPYALPSSRTELADTLPVSTKPGTLPCAKAGLTESVPAQPRGHQTAPPNPAWTPPASTQIAAQPQGDSPTVRPVLRTLHDGERVPAAPQIKAEPAAPSASALIDPPVARADLDVVPPLPVESTPNTQALPNLPVPANPPASATTSDGRSPQPKIEHASRPAGHQGPRSAHSGSHQAKTENSAHSVESTAPAPASSSESQTVSAKSEDNRAEAIPPKPAIGASSTAQPVNDAPSPVPVVPAQPPVPVASARVQPGKPAPQPDALAPSAVPVAPANLAATPPSLPTPPAPTQPPQAPDARTERRLWTAKDEPRLPEAPGWTSSAPQPRQAHPHTAPISGVASEKQNSSANPNPDSPAPSHAAPVVTGTSDRPAELPAPQVQANPTPSAPAPVAPVPSPVLAHAPPADVRHPRLPNHVSLAAQAGQDQGLSMTVMPHAAHVSIESSDGDLALHLRVRQGSADVTVGGSMAPLFEARAPEARAALASEGLNLGRFDLGQQGSGGRQGQPAPERPERAPEPATPYRQQSSNHEPTPGDGRIHVTA